MPRYSVWFFLWHRRFEFPAKSDAIIAWLLTPVLPLLLVTPPATATVSTGLPLQPTIVFIFSDSCPACQQFLSDIGHSYHQTHDATELPMTPVSLPQWQKGQHPFASCTTRPVIATPTFIQLINCEEQDRMTGYHSDELWWLGQRRMLNRALQSS